MEEEQSECPVTCPNRQTKEGLTLNFGKTEIHLDPFEILLWFLMAILPVGTSIREAWTNKLSFRESTERVATIIVLGSAIRKSPTEAIYQWLIQRQI